MATHTHTRETPSIHFLRGWRNRHALPSKSQATRHARLRLAKVRATPQHAHALGASADGSALRSRQGREIQLKGVSAQQLLRQGRLRASRPPRDHLVCLRSGGSVWARRGRGGKRCRMRGSTRAALAWPVLVPQAILCSNPSCPHP